MTNRKQSLTSETKTNQVPSRLFSTNEPPYVEALEKLCSQTTTANQCPLANVIESNIPIYNLDVLSYDDANSTNALQDEWHQVLLSGPGVIIFKHVYSDKTLLNRINNTFAAIIRSEVSCGNSGGDHFSSGTNSRIWNSFQKHGLQSPETFVAYYSNPWLALICEAWLGPACRITAQVNIVHPGGKAQICHRDYHLGFQTNEAAARWPKAMHVTSQLLTLQGGIAHSSMPLESGPTRFLPFSQMFEEGFLTYRLPEFQEFFEKHHVSLPLEMGDAVFFNPAIFHAAGENRTTDLHRSANLLQVSSAFGKTMESIDSLALVRACYADLQEKHQREGRSVELSAVVAAVAEGYPFPTNLDMSQPGAHSLAPASEQDVLMQALDEGVGVDECMRRLEERKQNSAP